MATGKYVPKLYSLLYFDKNKSLSVNLPSARRSSLDIWLQCGMTLAASCRFNKMQLTIITNDRNLLEERLTAIGGNLDILQMDFDRVVPPGIAFFSAHFKLDVLREMATGSLGDLVGLIDIDTVLLRPIYFESLPEDAIIIYDISDQVRAEHGDDRILADISSIRESTTKEAFWFGGEFICGTSTAIRQLSSLIERIWPVYACKHRSLHHAGDEMVVTAALCSLREDGLVLIDAGVANLVARWWTARTFVAQTSFAAIKNNCLLHLPSDKVFLANQSRRNFNPDDFIRRYSRYASRKLMLRRCLNLIATTPKPMYVAHLR